MSAFSGAKTAPVKWAQRKDSLYITIALADVTAETIEVTAKKLTFAGQSAGSEYKVELEFVRSCPSTLNASYTIQPW